MNKLMRTTLATLTIAATGFGFVAPTASAAPTQAAQLRVNATADCSRSKAINVTANVSHNAGSTRRIAVRAVFSRWNGNGWNASTATAWKIVDVPAMGQPVQFSVSAAAPAYFYVGVETYTQVPGTQTWASNTFRWLNTYTVSQPGAGTTSGAYCYVQDLSRTPY